MLSDDEIKKGIFLVAQATPGPWNLLNGGKLLEALAPDIVWKDGNRVLGDPALHVIVATHGPREVYEPNAQAVQVMREQYTELAKEVLAWREVASSAGWETLAGRLPEGSEKFPPETVADSLTV